MEDDLKVTFVEKLSKIVDKDEYKDIINDLIHDGKLEKPEDGKDHALRTTNEKEAKKVFELLEKYKSFHDQENEDASKDN